MMITSKTEDWRLRNERITATSRTQQCQCKSTYDPPSRWTDNEMTNPCSKFASFQFNPLIRFGKLSLGRIFLDCIAINLI